MTKIIFINGAPRAGKDTCAWLIANAYDNVYRLSFAEHLKIATHAAYGLQDFPPSYFESCKNDPSPLFLGLSPRQAYIKHSENYMKPLHGADIYGQLWLRKAQSFADHEILTVPDSGFVDEAIPAVKFFGKENCILLRVIRPGCDFSSDSRSHIELDGVRLHIVENTGTLELLRRKLLVILDPFIL